MLNNNTKCIHQQPVYRFDGKIIGHVCGETLKKCVTSDKHMLQKPRGWAWDEEVLVEAEKQGASLVEIHDRKSGKTYHASIRDFWDFGIAFNRGWGDQVVLPINFWDIQSPGEPKVEQLVIPI